TNLFNSHLYKAYRHFEREVILTLLAFNGHRSIRVQRRLTGFGLDVGETMKDSCRHRFFPHFPISSNRMHWATIRRRLNPI
ncbi:MAG: hypothetical protein OEW33_07420, partial [Nitrospirota bacterium]|nr:hypothetical protein [Nitrospirota bacterium]